MKKRENVPARRAFAFNKLLFALLAAALLLTGCNKRNAPPADVTDAAVVRVEPTAVLKAPYSDQDSLNPFFCTSYMNASLAPLLYEGLFLSDVQGNITPCAASSYTETEDGVVVAIPTASRFSDGSAMTSADVVYSFDAAKNSALYRNGLAGIDSAVAVSPYEIKFTFSDRLPGRVGALTFPLVKTGTAEGAGDVPVGSGRYYCSSSEDGVFFRWSEAYQGEWGQVAEIDLVKVGEQEKLTYMLSSGEIDFCLSDLYGQRMARTSAKTFSCPQNNLVYLGFQADSAFSDPVLRRAVSCAIDRAQITGSVYSGNAESTKLPMRETCRLVTQNYTQEISDAVDYAAASALLREGAYSPDDLRFTLLVNAESDYRLQAAECIVSSLAKIGVEVTLRSVGYDRYLELLQSGNFQMYLGEVKLPDSGALDVFFGGGAAAFGLSEESASAYRALCDGSGSPAAFIGTFLENVPFAPVCFRNDVLFCGAGIDIPDGVATLSQPLADVVRWQISDT